VTKTDTWVTSVISVIAVLLGLLPRRAQAAALRRVADSLASQARVIEQHAARLRERAQ
jgi:hypothetical protein